MSQFSESYHYRSNDQHEVAEILKKSNQEGFVLPPQNGWVTFVVKDSNFEPTPAIVNNNPGILLHYVYAEDHGWSIRLFDKSEEVSQYFCDWDDEIRIRNSKFDLKPFFKNGLIDEQSNIAELLTPKTFDELFDNEPYYKMAQELGLPYYDWMSYHYVEYSKDKFKGLLYITRK